MIKIVKGIMIVSITVLLLLGTATADEQFGLGITLGVPTGLNGKYFLDKYNALDAGFGWSPDSDHDFHIYADYLYHIYSLIDSGTGETPIYLGVGTRAVFRDHKDNKAGFRFPLGVEHLFKSVPFDVFAEIVPIFNVSPDTEFDMEGAVGARFYF
ncbi:MAG: hypothetical protein LJE89_15685 [Deltaproteobacteria bacterium]|nr:hypothetical protein [Deltaproteobacteria bacterium]